MCFKNKVKNGMFEKNLNFYPEADVLKYCSKVQAHSMRVSCDINNTKLSLTYEPKVRD